MPLDQVPIELDHVVGVSGPAQGEQFDQLRLTQLLGMSERDTPGLLRPVGGQQDCDQFPDEPRVLRDSGPLDVQSTVGDRARVQSDSGSRCVQGTKGGRDGTALEVRLSLGHGGAGVTDLDQQVDQQVPQPIPARSPGRSASPRRAQSMASPPVHLLQCHRDHPVAVGEAEVFGQHGDVVVDVPRSTAPTAPAGSGQPTPDASDPDPRDPSARPGSDRRQGPASVQRPGRRSSPPLARARARSLPP